MDKSDLAERIILLIETDPLGWSFSEYNAIYAGVKIWIRNSPFMDITIDDVKIGTFWQRRKIRKLLKKLKINAVGEVLLQSALGVHIEPGPRYKP